MAYEYKNGVKKLFSENSRNITIGVFVAAIIIAFIIVNSIITGFVTYNTELKKDLSNYEVNFVIVNQTLNACKNDLTACQANLQSCDTAKNNALNYSNIIKASLDICASDKEAILSNFTVMKDTYKNVLKAAVQTKCCSYDDVWTGTIKNWDFKDDKIVCSGGYIVNCTSGETNY